MAQLGSKQTNAGFWGKKYMQNSVLFLEDVSRPHAKLSKCVNENSLIPKNTILVQWKNKEMDEWMN